MVFVYNYCKHEYVSNSTYYYTHTYIHPYIPPFTYPYHMHLVYKYLCMINPITHAHVCTHIFTIINISFTKNYPHTIWNKTNIT